MASIVRRRAGPAGWLGDLSKMALTGLASVITTVAPMASVSAAYISWSLSKIWTHWFAASSR
jgi:hypothetical protein